MSARPPVIAGNWKMHGTVAETRAMLRELLPLVAGVTDREISIAPPFTSLAAAREELRGSNVGLAAQNVHWEPKGAFTGEVSAAMLLEVGCDRVIVGHSERRQIFGETDDGVRRRLRGALAAGLGVIACVGETLAEREAERTLEVVERQTRAALMDLGAADMKALCVAYEPVWAIGTGKTATPGQAQEIHAQLRNIVAKLMNKEAADRLRILYGGSVKADNIDALMAEPDIDGALVGGASLEVKSFARIVRFNRGS